MEVMLASSSVTWAALQMHGQSFVLSTASGPQVCSFSELEATIKKLHGATQKGPSALVGTGRLCSLCSRLAAVHPGTLSGSSEQHWEICKFNL